MHLDVIDIVKSYNNAPLLRGVTFTVEAGETICLLGRSGSGKSTLLRIIAGLEEAAGGSVHWDGTDISTLPVHQRGFGLMFQDFALFPHMTVDQNVSFGLRMQKQPEEMITDRTREMLDLVHMRDFARRRVIDLSGGEQQRIALARALAPRPRLLMLDEPLGALDRTLKQTLLDDLRQIIHSANIPVIYVTHDQEEAFSIADRLILLNSGRIEQIGTPEDIYRNPKTLWAANFLGLGNILPGTIISTGPLVASTVFGDVTLDHCDKDYSRGDSVNLLLLPAVEGLVIQQADLTKENSPNHVRFTGLVEESIFLEGEFRNTIRVGGTALNFFSTTRFNKGQPVIISYPVGEIRCL